MKKILLFVAGAFVFLAATPHMGLARVRSASYLQQSQPQAKTFTGVVIKNGENFVLNDSANKISYVLDDSQKASQFEGKKVKVTGTVDMASNTIHVETIQEVA